MMQETDQLNSSFDTFPTPESDLGRSAQQSLKQLLAHQILAAMQQDKLTKSEMALRMQTSRRALDRLLDPNNTSVTLHTLQRAAAAVGRQLRLELI
jgi:antitoxin HicB